MVKGEQTLFHPVLITSVLAFLSFLCTKIVDSHKRQNLPTLDLIILWNRLGKDPEMKKRPASSLPSRDACCPGHGEEEEQQVTWPHTAFLHRASSTHEHLKAF